MKDLKKVQEFFSKPLEEAKEETAIDMAKRQLDALGVKYELGNEFKPFKTIYKPTGKSDKFYDTFNDIVDLFNLGNAVKSSMSEAKEEDPTDIIAMDVPLFIRMLEYAREDAEQDVDLHKVTERAIEAVKLRGLLSMEDYQDIVGVSKDKLDEIRLIPKDQLEALAAKLAAQIFSKRQDNKPAINILKKALEDAYRALDPEVVINEKTGYSKYLEETIRLGEGMIEEELCAKGKAYRKRRIAAGEKSSAYLSGRAVKVCKGQMSGRKKK